MQQKKSAEYQLFVKYALFQFFFTLLIWTPVFYEYQRIIGINETNIFFIQSVYYIVFAFVEIPTGWIADKFGYLISMKLGALILVLCNLIPIFAPTYYGMMVHFIVLALSRSLISGASSTYLFEHLRNLNNVQLYNTRIRCSA